MPNHLSNTDLATLREDLARLESAPAYLLPDGDPYLALRDALIEAYTAEIEARGESVDVDQGPSSSPWLYL